MSDFDVSVEEKKWRSVFGQISDFQYLEHGWDGESAAVPGADLIQSAQERLILDKLYGVQAPDRVLATLDGGIIIEWQLPDRLIVELEIEEPWRGEIISRTVGSDPQFQEISWSPVLGQPSIPSSLGEPGQWPQSPENAALGFGDSPPHHRSLPAPVRVFTASLCDFLTDPVAGG